MYIVGDMKRHEIYKTFAQFKKSRDDRSMNSLCDTDEDFKLQAQQNFLREFVDKHPDWDKLMLYHQIGSGKTCTAITIAEHHMTKNPKAKTIVILPARLRTNFYDELMTPCAMDKYISQSDFTKYKDPDTTEKARAKIKSTFIHAVSKKYEIISFEKFKDMAKKAQNIQRWVEQFTKDRIVIVDEVHNLVSNNYNKETWRTLDQTHRLTKGKGLGSIIFKYMCKNVQESCKMLFLTATPIFNDISQFKELVTILRPTAVLPTTNTIRNYIELLRGKVSFFPGTSPNAYPHTEYSVEEIPLSQTQDSVIEKIMEADEEEQDVEKEAFLVFQRMAAVVCLPRNIKPNTPERLKNIVDNTSEYAPKLKHLVDAIEQHRGKHVVYSTFIQSGLSVVEALLKSRGWMSWKDAVREKDVSKRNNFKTYAVWDSTAKDADKQHIKSIVNSKDNLDGKNMRVILGSPSIKEGVSFKHIQHLHMIDPVWNSSAMSQIEGRAIRFCSHVEIPKDHEFLKRTVTIHHYKSIPMNGDEGQVTQTADQRIYDQIIPEKQRLVRMAENALKKVSIDYFLFRKMYGDFHGISPATPNTSPSPISIEENGRVVGKQRNQEFKKTNTCPKPRRPNDAGRCPQNYVKRKNAHDDDCCYKIRPVKSTCPSKRRPVKDPETKKVACKDKDQYLKKNKSGHECCYKKKKSSSTA